MQRNCASCGVLYDAKRPNSKYHNDTCRKRAQRAPVKPAEMPPPPLLLGNAPLTAAVRSELTAAARLDSMLGQAALALAGRIDSPHESGASVASLVKQLRETMVDALKGAEKAADVLDEIRARRDRKRSAG